MTRHEDITRYTKLAPLLGLYFAQGLPFGFQATALPLLLRERGASLETIGFAGVLALPWLFKPLWAPLVDRLGSARFGRRKSWIVPMQLGLAACAVFAAHVESLPVLALTILVMNLFAATQDIAVDALAVRALDEKQLGLGNAIQVIGYKLGMLTGGGLLVWASARIGWSGLFYAMGGLMLGILLWTLTIREAPEADLQERDEPLRFAELYARLKEATRQPSTAALLLIVVTYKSGETLADHMWKPLLLDRGFSAAQIGLWSGTFGMIASIVGSGGAGLLARNVSLPRALVWTAAFRTLGVAGEWWISSAPQVNAASVIGVTCLEHFAGGALTTVLFALMMRHTDKQIGATHYTLLASLEVLGKMPFGPLSGVMAQRLSYEALFATATALCVAFAFLAQGMRPKLSGEPTS